MRPLKVHSNDYRLPRLMPKSTDENGEYIGCQWTISVGEALAAQADILVHPTDELLSFLSDSRDRLTSLAGHGFQADCEKVYIKKIRLRRYVYHSSRWSPISKADTACCYSDRNELKTA